MNRTRAGRPIVVSAWWEGATINGERVAIFSMRIFERRANRYVVESVSLDPHAIDRIAYGRDSDERSIAHELLAHVVQRAQRLRRIIRHRWRVLVLGANYQQRLYIARKKRWAMANWDKHDAQLYEFRHVGYERERFARSLEKTFGPTPARTEAP